MDRYAKAIEEEGGFPSGYKAAFVFRAGNQYCNEMFTHQTLLS